MNIIILLTFLSSTAWFQSFQKEILQWLVHDSKTAPQWHSGNIFSNQAHSLTNNIFVTLALPKSKQEVNHHSCGHMHYWKPLKSQCTLPAWIRPTSTIPKASTRKDLAAATAVGSSLTAAVSLLATPPAWGAMYAMMWLWAGDAVRLAASNLRRLWRPCKHKAVADQVFVFD